MAMNSVELTNHWKQHLRNSRATSLKGMRRYRKLMGEDSPIANYFEGKAQASNEAIRILEYMLEYQEMFHGNG
jgi:hypothetical protein